MHTYCRYEDAKQALTKLVYSLALEYSCMMLIFLPSKLSGYIVASAGSRYI